MASRAFRLGHFQCGRPCIAFFDSVRFEMPRLRALVRYAKCTKRLTSDNCVLQWNFSTTYQFWIPRNSSACSNDG